MLYEYILYLQGIELGIGSANTCHASLLKDAVKKKSAVNISFLLSPNQPLTPDKKQSNC